MELAIVAIIGVMLVFGFIKMEKDRVSVADQKYAGNPELKAALLQKKIWIGMTEDQLIDSWGVPSKRAVRQLKTRIKTTLHYGSYRRVYLHDGQVTSWHQPPSQ